MEECSLHKACEEALISRVKILLDRGEDVNGRDKFERTPLHCAIDISLTTCLDSIVSETSKKDEDVRCQCAIAELLLLKGANVNTIGHRASGVTPLHVASSRGNLKMVNLLLKHRADPNYRCEEGKTPLHLAARSGFRDVTLKLVENGCSVNSIDYHGRTPLCDAVVELRSLDVVKILIQLKANVNWLDNELKSPLHYSMKCKNYEASKLLLENGANILLADGTGSTPLHYAVNTKDIKSIKLALSHYANVNSKNNVGDTALHLAVKLGNHRVVKLLLSHYADPNIKNDSMQSPLHITILQWNAKPEIVLALLEHDADVSSTDCLNMTPLDLVLDPRCSSQIKELIVSYVIKLKAASLIRFKYIIPENFDSTYFVQCLNEVRLIKEKGYYHILIAPICKIVDILRNDKSEKKLCSFNYSVHFPIYSKIFNSKMERAMNRKKLIISAEAYLDDLFSYADHWPRLPPECYPFILKYLSDRDIKMFIKFCKKYCQ